MNKCRLLHQTVLLGGCTSCGKIRPYLTLWSIPSTVVHS